MDARVVTECFGRGCDTTPDYVVNWPAVAGVLLAFAALLWWLYTIKRDKWN